MPIYSTITTTATQLRYKTRSIAHLTSNQRDLIKYTTFVVIFVMGIINND